MKVITEEWIKNSIVTAQQVSESGAPGADALVVVLNAMLKHCQELDTLTVKRLRPMSEAPRKPPQFILACNHHNELFKVQYVVQYGRWFLEDGHTSFNDDSLIGFIPMPRYEPEEQQ